MRIRPPSECRPWLFPNSHCQATANRLHGLRLMPVIFCHSRAKMLTGIVNVRYGRLYRFGRYETHIPSTWLKYRLAFQYDHRRIAAASRTVMVGSIPSSNSRLLRTPLESAVRSFVAIFGAVWESGYTRNWTPSSSRNRTDPSRFQPPPRLPSVGRTFTPNSFRDSRLSALRSG
jgi:hypothetical protein